MGKSDEESPAVVGKGLACQSCRKRRRKCNLDSPCSNCQKYGVECVPINQDLRRRRHSAAYLRSLENKICQLEALVDDLKSKKDQKITSAQNAPAHGAQIGGSIYPTNSLSLSYHRSIKATEVSTETPRSRLKNMSRSLHILEALSLFFKWLYPGHYTFIHRETFLSALFGEPSTKAYYCSEELVYAIAALGSTLSSKSQDLYHQSSQYYNLAKRAVLQKVFQLDDSSLVGSTSSSKLAIVQTLLCLAFYDIGHGENPLAWYSSGLAFRIAHEIGLHLNPESWSNVYEDELSNLDIEVRSRIYWGCYIADHLICVLFGRSTSLRLSNSTVPETDELPDIETGIEDYLYDPRATLSMAKPLKELIVLSRITELFASKIFIQTESLAQRSEHLERFNSEINQWRLNLPDELKWTKELLENNKDFNPTVAYLWYHYYIILLSYNKPFIEELNQSKSMIEETIEELYLLLISFKSKCETFEKCSIYMVYTAILAIQCSKVNNSSNRYLLELKEYLISSTLNYELGRKFMDNEAGNDANDLFGALSNGDDFALEYNFDFTLLKEIDTLIGGI
ncbi:LAQU0S25e00518g1_1 [Lachancea quebecensis]|uniref:LAQU0S25e00518g1_1 n=1 Tax=Lachancea quebecensis TaxID=1654605 RepID=A0A0P1KXM9_9SACH|nr:LAQU0S25e00518g1_1 [Lachancea quebecensis]